MIKSIDINKIHHHPDNPRKDLGDLTELAESIKQSGVLQNLTLVPWYSQTTGVGCDDPKQQEEMGYYAVIGNRRLAAAKLAGLTEVPCAISDMDHKTQVATMLLENMQRVDLTVYEQAQGFQMMLNLGESISDISEKTGFSETTVRRRMKLLELDQDKLKESVQRGATLMDYAELEKIENVRSRNKVLAKIGTDDFKYTLQKAIDDEKREKRISEIIKQLDKFATKAEKMKNFVFVRSYSTYSDIVIEVPKDSDKIKYFYEPGQYYISLYKENSPQEEDREDKENKDKEMIKRQKREARRAEQNELSKRAYKLRSNFIKELSNTKARKNIESVIEASLFANAGGNGSCIEYEELAEIMGIDISDNEDNIEWKDIVGHIWKQPELYLLQATYNQMDNASETYFYWDLSYRPNENLDYIYNFLEKLGYKMSEEEQAMKDGTHELFRPEE